MAQDYYATLGVQKGASEDDIRKAYREAARKYHPDLHPDDKAAKQKFQDVQQAFDVLNDPKKREMYDRYGAGFEQMAGAPGGGGNPFGAGGNPFGAGAGGENVQFDFGDLGDLFGGARAGGGPGGAGGFADFFENLSRGRNNGPGARRGRAKPGPQKGQDVEHEITVPFNTAVKGGETTLSLARDGGATETITVKIPKGHESGRKIRLRGQGNPSMGGGPDGDLLLKVNVAPHPVFHRRGKRLDVTAPVTLKEAMLGAKIDIPTPKGAVTVSVPAGASGGQKLRIKGHGIDDDKGEPGDLFVELDVVLPDDLSEEERQKLAEIAGDRPANPRAELRW